MYYASTRNCDGGLNPALAVPPAAAVGTAHTILACSGGATAQGRTRTLGRKINGRTSRYLEKAGKS